MLEDDHIFVNFENAAFKRQISPQLIFSSLPHGPSAYQCSRTCHVMLMSWHRGMTCSTFVAFCTFDQLPPLLLDSLLDY